MPDITALPRRWWFYILLAATGAAVLSIGIGLVLPKEYRSETVAFPTNSSVTDRAHLFNNNIQSLYPLYGTEEELDKLEGTSKLDTIYKGVIGKLRLHRHYGYDSSAAGLHKTLKKLRALSQIKKTPYGQLSVSAIDRDPAMAADVANALMEEIILLHQRLQQQAYSNKAAGLRQALTQLSQHDSIPAVSGGGSPGFSELIRQYESMAATASPVLLVAQQATPGVYPYRPKIWLMAAVSFAATMLLAWLISLFFFSSPHDKGYQ